MPGQFLSPLANRRRDGYGGSLENRTRFLREVVEACREAVGDAFIVGVRFTADESNEHGLAAADGVEVGRILGRPGVADFLNVNGAYSGTFQGVNAAFPDMETRSLPYIELARRVKEASGLPTMQASRIDTLSTANFAIEQGYLDMAGMTRPHLADPQIVGKLKRGEEHRIRPCVGAGYCLDRPYRGLDALCLHNPLTSREINLPHEVSKAETPDLVVLATGGLPIQDLPEGGEDLTLTPWDILGQPRAPTGRVLFYDQNGAESAMSTAQYLAKTGALVTFATPDRLPGYDIGAQNLPVFMKALLKRDARFLSDTQLLGVRREGNGLAAKCRNRYTGDTADLVRDTVVVDQGVAPDPVLFDELAPASRNKGDIDLDALADFVPQPNGARAAGDYNLYRIGDALMSRNVHAAIFEARRLCMTV